MDMRTDSILSAAWQLAAFKDIQSKHCLSELVKNPSIFQNSYTLEKLVFEPYN